MFTAATIEEKHREIGENDLCEVLDTVDGAITRHRHSTMEIGGNYRPTQQIPSRTTSYRSLDADRPNNEPKAWRNG